MLCVGQTRTVETRQLGIFALDSHCLAWISGGCAPILAYSMISLSLTSRIILTLCFMALLGLASLTPGRPQPGDSSLVWLVANTPTFLQKLLHVCLYAVLVLLWVWTLNGIQSTTYRFVIAWIIAVAFGVVMEWYQLQVPGRFGTVVDVVLDATGASLGLLAAAFFQ